MTIRDSHLLRGVWLAGTIGYIIYLVFYAGDASGPLSLGTLAGLAVAFGYVFTVREMRAERADKGRRDAAAAEALADAIPDPEPEDEPGGFVT